MNDSVFTFALVVVTCLVSWRGFKNRAFEEKHIFRPESILADKEYHRLVTSGFLHADFPHLAFNMFSFYVFGRVIEFVHGPVNLLAIYFGAIVGGNLLSLYLHRFHDYTAYGASGGVCGIIFAHIFLFPGGEVGMFPVPIGIPSWLYAILFLAGSFYALKNKRDNIGHDAHLGGAIIGLAITTAMHPYIISESPKLYATVAGLSLLILVYLIKNPLFLPWKVFLATRPATERKFSFLPKSKKKQLKVDALLDKISSEGLDSLTKEERAFLDGISDKYRRREQSKKPESELIF